jgi:hypothetical protein
MVECNNLVIDLISVTTDDDDSSSSTVDSYFDSFTLELADNGGVFVRDKAIMIDMDDETTSRTATFDGSFDTDFSCCSSPSLSEDSWYRERAVRPSKQPRYVLSRVFLAAAIVVPRDGYTGINHVGRIGGANFFASSFRQFC